jgi:hypothetical protein
MMTLQPPPVMPKRRTTLQGWQIFEISMDLHIEWASTSPQANAAEPEAAGVAWTVVRYLDWSGAAFKSEGGTGNVQSFAFEFVFVRVM